MTEDDVVAGLVRAAAPEVLADALIRARELATTRLADRLADALVAAALAGAAPPAAVPTPRSGRARPAPDRPEPARPEPIPTESVEPARSGPAPAAAPTTALYAYAITPAGSPVPDAEPLAGGERLTRVADGDLALLVSSVEPARLRVDQDDLSETGPLATLVRGHDAVLTAAAAAGPVLPLRFGTVVPDEDAARRLLRTHGASAREQLDRIGDAREWGVRLVRTLAEPAPAAAGGEVSGTEFLAQRRRALTEAEEAGAVAERASRRVEEALAPLTRASLRRGGSPGSSLLLDLAYLVEPGREAEVTAALERLAAEEAAHGLGVELTGPWPPYSFASLEEGGPGGA
ncbi:MULTISPECIES: GvpL/GvpF family gas vesicle protein [unclassified Blastococcus]